MQNHATSQALPSNPVGTREVFWPPSLVFVLSFIKPLMQKASPCKCDNAYNAMRLMRCEE